MPERISSSDARLLQLDGARGAAILLVCWAHSLGGVFPTESGWWRKSWGLGIGLGSGGGFIGVQLFFVLSGFLITRLLVRDLQDFGGVRFGRFYLRRARRLYPALTTTCAAYLVYALVWPGKQETSAAWGTTIRALTYTTNLRPLLDWLPDSLWLSHTWSLAVEEQFYLLWPLLITIAWRLHRIAPLCFAIIGALAIVYLRTVSKSETLNYELLRFDALLLGCAYGLYPSLRIGSILQIAGILLMFFYLLCRPLVFSTWDYLLSSIACALFLRHALSTKWLSHPFLRYFGQISYGLYLWHILLARPGLPAWIWVPTSIAVAHFSYFRFERHFLKKA